MVISIHSLNNSLIYDVFLRSSMGPSSSSRIHGDIHLAVKLRIIRPCWMFSLDLHADSGFRHGICGHPPFFSIWAWQLGQATIVFWILLKDGCSLARSLNSWQLRSWCHGSWWCKQVEALQLTQSTGAFLMKKKFWKEKLFKYPFSSSCLALALYCSFEP